MKRSPLKAYLLPVLAIGSAVFATVTVVRTQPVRTTTEPASPPPASSFSQTVAAVGLVEASTEHISVGTPVSGLVADYDPTRPVGARLGRVRVGDAPLEDARIYRVATNSFLAEGGDGYAGFLDGRLIRRDRILSELILDHVRRVGTVRPPAPGRLVVTRR